MKAHRPSSQDLAKNGKFTFKFCNFTFSKIGHLQSQNEGEDVPMQEKMCPWKARRAHEAGRCAHEGKDVFGDMGEPFPDQAPIKV